MARISKTHIWKDASHEAHLLMDAVGWLRNGPQFELGQSESGVAGRLAAARSDLADKV
jgi:hypothetical protein